jgi:hypothetical protein
MMLYYWTNLHSTTSTKQLYSKAEMIRQLLEPLEQLYVAFSLPVVKYAIGCQILSCHSYH